MSQRNWFLLAVLVFIFGVSAMEALYFSGARFIHVDDKQIDSIAYVFPFQPVAIMYAADANPWLGVPINLLALLSLLYCSAFFSYRPIWQKLILFFSGWLILSVFGSIMVLKTVWQV